MIRRLGLLTPLLLPVATFGQAPPDVAKAITAEGLEHSHVMDYLDHLTNAIGHRLTGSDNYRRAAEWAKAEFEKMGLHVELEHWATWKTGWDRGQWSGRVVKPIDMELQVATPAWTAGTRGAVTGPLLPMPTSEEELEQLGDKVRGAYLFNLGSIPDYEAEAKARAAGRRGRRRGGRSGGTPAWLRDRAAELGIAGFVQSSVGTLDYPNRIRVFADRTNKPWLSDTQPTIPEIVVRYDQATKLRELINEGDVAIEFDIRNRFRPGPIELFNVVAELEGSAKPDEYVVVCGHLDSWHQATGTTDNGTGTTSTLEAARILTAVGAKPARTIRFCLWGGEEQGLLGSTEHVRRRRTEMNSISAVLNHDTGTNWAQSLTVTEKMLPLFEQVMAPVMELTPPDADFDGPVFELRGVPELRAGGGSDHASFATAGVPGLGWGLEGRSDYFNYTWHSQWDTYDNAIPEYQRHTATVIALTALGLADLPELLPRDGVLRGRGNRGGDATAMLSGRLGVEFSGLEIKAVKTDGMAAGAGIERGDVITAVNGQKIKTVADIFGVLRDGGDFRAPVKLTLQRGEEEVKLEVSPFGRRNGRGR